MNPLIKKMSLPFAMLLTYLSATAQTFEVGGINYSVTDEAAATVKVISKSQKYSREVNIPESVPFGDKTYSVTEIGDFAFDTCRDLTSVTIPNSVTSIGACAFVDCSSLKSVTIPNSVTSIGNSVFYGCSSLQSVTIPNSITSISNCFFVGCRGLTSVTIPNSVTSIGYMAFSGCRSLTSLTIPNSVTSIGYRAFEDCRGLTSVTISNSVTSIDNNTFADCRGLTSVNIPNSVTSIGNGVFYGCSGLTSVTIPNSITSIGGSVFYGCSGMMEVNYNTTEPISAPTYVFDTYTYDTTTLYVAVGGLEAAKRTEPWSLFKDIREKEFEEPVEREVLVKLPGGNLHLPEEAEGLTVRLTADEGFEFHSATLDGEDVSHLVGDQGHFTVPAVEKPMVLNVVFKQSDNPETGINVASLDDDDVRVAVHGKRVSISGKDAATAVRAYDLHGVLLEDTTDSEFTLDHGGVVILRIGSATYKFAI